MPQAIIFDMDGVLINSTPSFYLAERAMFEELHIEVPEKFHLSLQGSTTRDFWTAVKKNFPIGSYSVDDLIALNRARYNDLIEEGGFPRLVPGVVAFIDRIKDKAKITVASSASRHTINRVFEKHSLGQYFSTFTSAEEVAFGKPDPAVFLKAAEKLDVVPEACVVIEDSESGVHAAKAANMRCIGFANPGSPHQNLAAADTTIQSFDSITWDFLCKLS